MKHSKVRTGELLSNSFLIQNVLKQGDALSPLLLNLGLKYAIRKERVRRSPFGTQATSGPILLVPNVR
jgi:hypothetical protein